MWSSVRIVVLTALWLVVESSQSSKDGLWSLKRRQKRWITPSDPEVRMEAVQLIARWGYHPEEHTVLTQDGYLLSVQRIPFGLNNRNNTNPRPVIFLQHGLESASTDWITNVPDKAAAFMFADAGYDVWLGNVRGNTYGLRHVQYYKNEPQFWKFSWDEMAKYDLPAMINYVLEHTDQKQLYYVGHSQGTMTAFAAFSQNKDLAAKWLFDVIGPHEFLPKNWLTYLFANTICDWKSTNDVCNNLIFMISGPDSHQLNETRLPVYLGHTPAGTSSRNIIHYSQQVNSGNFQMFDYGETGNTIIYGTEKAPLYNISNVEVDTYLFWGGKDWLANPADVRNTILPHLPRLRGNSYLKEFNHMDFIWGQRAAAKVYQKILDTIEADDNGAILKLLKSNMF